MSFKLVVKLGRRKSVPRYSIYVRKSGFSFWQGIVEKMTKCKKCGKNMKADIENERYICECGFEIKWGGELEDENTLYF